jgi:uncharacterized protein YfaS (alpha-2-macroglobulin family)
MDHIAMSGILSGGSSEEIPVRLPEAAVLAPEKGTWHLRLARGLEEDLDGALGYLVGYRYGCAEQTASTLLPLLLFPKHPVVASQGKIEARVKTKFERLTKMKVKSRQPEDEGGIGFWPGAPDPDLFATAWALLVLAHAPADAGAQAQVASLAKATTVLLAKSGKDRYWSPAVRALGHLALARSQHKVTEVPTPAPAYEPITTGFSALALVLAAANDAAALPQAREKARGWLSEAILRLPEHARLLHVQASDIARDLPSSRAEVGELALAWALARIWPDHPARAKLARALSEHRRASEFGSTFENALFLILAADTKQQTSGQGMVEARADGIQLLSPVGWPEAGKVHDRSWSLRELPKSFFDQNDGGRFMLAAQGDGELFYSLDASYPPKNPSGVHEHGLSVTIHLRDPRHASSDATEVAAGELLAMDIVVGARSAQEHVVIDVPLPAGLEAINPDIPIESLAVGPDVVAHKDFAFAHQELQAERVLIFPRSIRPGLAKHTIFLRALLAGNYEMPGAHAEVMYSPEIRGRGQASRVTVLPQRP